MKSKLYRIYGALICIIIISFLYASNNTAQKYSTYPSTMESEFKKYTGMDGKIQFQLPASWNLTTENFEGGEIEYHGNFNSKDKSIKGIIQLWKIKRTLSEFLQDAKLGETGIIEYKYYKIQEAKIGADNGYILEYSRLGNDGKYYNATEYFIPKKDNEFLRISFFMEDKKYKPSYKALFNNIASRILYSE